ncbi:MAG: c-type cytochrome, partial [Armatimonadota bacterium]|nr:c-type cytochrome [Armatimonadota bacterium]
MNWQKNAPTIVVGAVLALSGSLAVTSAITPPPKPLKVVGAKKPVAKAADATLTAMIGSGKKIYDANGCAGCHAIGGKGGDSAPALDKTAADPKRTIHWFEVQVSAPKTHTPASTMPAFAASIKGKDLTAVATFLESLKGTPGVSPAPEASPTTLPAAPATSTGAPTSGTSKIAPAILEAGKKAYGVQGCGNCHAMNGAGGGAGPDLGRTGADPKHTLHWFEVQIVSPTVHTPDSTMPPFPQVKGKNLIAMASYLTSLTGPQDAMPAPTGVSVAAPDAAVVAAMAKQGGMVQPLAQNDNHLDV